MLLFSEILHASEGILINKINEPDIPCTISTDTRHIQQGQIFLALSGENFDGHNFIEMAVQKGAGGFIVSKSIDENTLNNLPLIMVKDTLKAYLQIAQHYRRKINPKVIAITGSSGKTTTKEFVYETLVTTYKVHKSFANHNNEIGLCQTLLTMPSDTEILVVEMGMRGLNEIRLLAHYAYPDIAIITNIGTAHLGRMGNPANIAVAKCELLEEMNPQGTAFLYNQKVLLEQAQKVWHGKTIIYGDTFELDTTNESFTYKGESYKTSYTGKHHINNMTACIEVAQHLHVPYETILKAVSNFSVPQGRGNFIQLKSGITLVDDTYNANPESMKNALIALYDKFGSQNIGIVLGDMQELGENTRQLHQEIAAYIHPQSTQFVITVGETSQALLRNIQNTRVQTASFQHVEETYAYLKDQLANKTINILFLKGSRAAQLDKIVKMLSMEL